MSEVNLIGITKPSAYTNCLTAEEMFGDPGTTEQRIKRMNMKGSMLDSVLNELNAFNRTIGAEDNLIMDSFTTSVREVDTNDLGMFDPSGGPYTAVGDKIFGVSFDKSIDLMRLAFMTDLTRVASFMVAHEASGQSYGFLGLQSTYHSTSHHGNVPELLEDYAKLSTYHVYKFSQFVDNLLNTPTAHGNLLDASYFYFGAGISNGNAHDRRNVPAMIVGKANGRLEGNKAIYLNPDRPWVPTSNLLLALGDIAGVELDVIGESTGRLEI